MQFHQILQFLATCFWWMDKVLHTVHLSKRYYEKILQLNEIAQNTEMVEKVGAGRYSQ